MIEQERLPPPMDQSAPEESLDEETQEQSYEEDAPAFSMQMF